MRFPLYAKILVWFFLNLLLLVAVFVFFVQGQFRFGMESLLGGRGGERVQAVASLIQSELADAERSDWDEILSRFSEAYQVSFALFRNDGSRAAGEAMELPPLITARVREGIAPLPLQLRRPGQPGQPGESGQRPFGGPPLADPGRLRASLPPAEGIPPGEQPAVEILPPVSSVRPVGTNAFFNRGYPEERGDFPREGQPRRRPGEDSVRPSEIPRNPNVPFPGGNFRPDGQPRPDLNPRPPGFEREDVEARRRGFAPRNIMPKEIVRTEDPRRYWVLVRLPLPERDPERNRDRGGRNPFTLVLSSPTLAAGGLLLDYKPWFYAGVTAIGLSALLWFPLVRGITRSLSLTTAATERIAEGHFDTRLPERRRDELGRLGQAVNRMAARLAGFVQGQKRFTGDIAHELCAPIARIQMALGILEQRADASQKAYVDDLREEVQHMSGLVNELLSFSKASLRPKELKLSPVNLAELAQRVVSREADKGADVQVQIAESIRAQAEPELLSRALANLVRNAIRYAGDAGTITISAATTGDRVVLSVNDCGPGVPETVREQIFDPFFRVEQSRSRDTGGAGLGLAIVRTCVEACQGTVTARNRQPSGLQVDITLRGC